MAEKSSKSALSAAHLAMKSLALAMLALAYAAAPAHAQQCGAQAGGALCPDGLCCSEFGYCGITSAYCGTGCQSQCSVSTGRSGDAVPVQAPQCGAQARGELCPNGLCCSEFGYCGVSSAYCGRGCQSQCRVSSAPGQAPQCGAQARGRLCPDGLCCSEFGYCGVTSAYCGRGCQSQCRVNVDSAAASVVTRELFDQMLPRLDDAACPDREFYTYDAFLAAARAFPAFGATGDEDARKREVAAFMAQASHGTTSSSGGPSHSGGFCYKEANGVTSDYCVPNTQFPCAPNKTYHARGPMQISYNYKYGLASQAIAEDLLRNPELVATDPVVAFKTALWLWMTPGDWNQPSCHAVITGLWTATPPHQAAGRVPGFGLTTNILTGGRHCAAQDSGRVGLYKRYSNILGVSYGPNLDCRGQVPFEGDIEALAK